MTRGRKITCKKRKKSQIKKRVHKRRERKKQTLFLVASINCFHLFALEPLFPAIPLASRTNLFRVEDGDLTFDLIELLDSSRLSSGSSIDVVVSMKRKLKSNPFMSLRSRFRPRLPTTLTSDPRSNVRAEVRTGAPGAAL